MDEADKYPSQLAERFQVRLPDGMRDKLRSAAEANSRSMNAEIVARLEHSVSRYEIIDDNMHTEPRRNSVLMRTISKAEKLYNDLCEKIEAKNKIIEAENERLAEEYKRQKESQGELKREIKFLTLSEPGKLINVNTNTPDAAVAGVMPPKVEELGGQEAVVQMARVFLAASQRGAIEALGEAFGPAVVASLQVGEVLKQVEPGAAPAVYAFHASSSEDELHFPALLNLVGRLLDTSPEVDLLCVVNWPRRFADLPADTRSGLIDVLREDAPGVYESLMHSVGQPDSSGQLRFRPGDQGAAAAIRRMRDAVVLYRVGNDEGPAGPEREEGARVRR